MRQLDEIWQRAWTPPDRRPPWQWCEDHVTSIPYSPIPGRFRSENSLMIREPMEAIVDARVKKVCNLAPIQSCKTACSELALTYIIPNMPGPALWLDRSNSEATDQMESRLQKLFAEVEAVRALFPADRHKKRKDVIHFANGMPLWVLGGGEGKGNLQRRSVRWLFCDEVWEWKRGNLAEAMARVTAFGWLGKTIVSSQAGEVGDDLDQFWETTDRREWQFSCPHCSTLQPWLWENIEWDKDAKTSEGWDFAKIRKGTAMRCASCNHYFEDTDRTRRQLNAASVFVPQNLEAASDSVGFHWNALATMPWGALVELYLRAKMQARMGDTTALKQFYQKRLALPWREMAEDYKLEITTTGYQKGGTWADVAGIDRMGRIVPAGTEGAKRFLYVLTVDVQQDHYYAVVRAWSANGSSRLIWHEKVLQLSDIEAIQTKFLVAPALVFVDCGHDTYNVYRECAARGWTALMGHEKGTFAHKLQSGKAVERFYSPRRSVSLGSTRCLMHYFSNLNIKDTLARLRRNQDPEKGPTWEVYEDVCDEYKKQLESEHRVKDGGKWRWKQIGSRPNHYWDCEVMQACAATMLKIIGQESACGETEEGAEEQG